jgi:single-strand DNA-binding protein
VGRLTRDPETRRTSTSKTVCKFDIAIGRRFKDAATGEWKDADPTVCSIVFVWGNTGEQIAARRLRKGMPVHVEGRLQTNSWQATDGTKKSRIEVIASRVQILVRSDQAPAAKTKVEDADNEYVSENDVNMGDEEVPF